MRPFVYRWPSGLLVLGLTSGHLLVAIGNEFRGEPYAGDDVFSDTWVATDALGREVPGAPQCGAVRNEKWVGIFYWTWHTGRTGLGPNSDHGPNDNTKILARAKNGKVSWPTVGRTHYWGEPELGYYRATDT